MGKQLLFLICTVLLVLLQYHLWSEPGGIIDVIQLKKKRAIETEKNNAIRKHNDIIQHQVSAMKSNSDAIESRARSELGMIKKGETFYQVVK